MNETMKWILRLIVYELDGIGLLILLCTLCIYLARIYYFKKNRRCVMIHGREAKTVAFFHPYANTCGGGEKVLWGAVKSLQEIAEFQPIHCIIYTGDRESKEEILEKTRRILHYDIKSTLSLEIIHLRTRRLLEAENYRHFTLLLQSLASSIVAVDALLQVVPDIFFDTTGLAFTYPVVKLLTSARILSYTHFPTISTDMLQRVRERRVQYNNSSFISKSVTISTLKLAYYHAFSLLYGLVGRCADLVMVNGTWTYNHIIKQWRQPQKTFIVYPPCDITEMKQISSSGKRTRSILSIGQFRPEKDHMKQLVILRKLLDIDTSFEDIKLVLIGGCRNEEDFKRVEELKQKVRDLALERNVVFEVNAPYSRVMQYLSECKVGIHTMWNEHFGICVVELLAAGVLTIGHNSAGPKEDIICPAYPLEGSGYRVSSLTECEKTPVGFLAASVEEYVKALEFIFNHENELNRVVEAGRARATIFSFERFELSVKEKIGLFL